MATTHRSKQSPRPLRRQDIVEGLRRLGLRAGDHVMVHSALSSLGEVAGGAKTVVEALIEAVGPEGTVLVPTFACGDEVFDPERSDSGLGAVSNALWKRPDAVRSRHPLASVAAVGRLAEEFCDAHERATLAHGPGTPYLRLAERGGKTLLLGVDQDRHTLLHTAEEMARLAYLGRAKGSWRDAEGGTKSKTWRYFPGPHRDFIGLGSWLEAEGLVRTGRIGRAVARLHEAAPLLAALGERIADEPDLYLSTNPNLPDGVSQRAALLRERLGREDFLLAADSRHAGQYLEEVIETADRCGIGAVVLSCVNDTPWQRIPARRRKWLLRGLKDASLAVAAVRVRNAECELVDELLAETGCERLICESTDGDDRIAAYARKGRQVLVRNVGLGGAAAAERVETIAARAAGEVALAFDPLSFAEAGENPFLSSWTRSRARRHVGALLVNDGLATGERMPLACGLAEVRELVSILRCRGFEGLFVLEGNAGEDYEETFLDFLEMLEELGSCPDR